MRKLPRTRLCIYIYLKHQEIVHYWVYEHRNSDILCVKEFYGTFINTPTINDIPMKDKYDYTKDFNYGEISQCGEWIIKSALSKLKEYLENISSVENLEDLKKILTFEK